MNVEYTAKMTMTMSTKPLKREFLDMIIQSGNFPHRRCLLCTEVSSFTLDLLCLKDLKTLYSYNSSAFISEEWCFVGLLYKGWLDPPKSSQTVQNPKNASSLGRFRLPDLEKI